MQRAAGEEEHPGDFVHGGYGGRPEHILMAYFNLRESEMKQVGVISNRLADTRDIELVEYKERDAP